ncbi:ComA protein [Pseudoscardovia radai]|uniref:ComA protein n=1 Tax=Pseudoscardovia radai TaxID=987066 RepID=A0A261F0T9_9BIFI|nr:ComEC/Rec2 family competence protein [Pseudoscardovia radai]OZG52695.1 ComA protein [Pseudoscardovia radai]
MTHPDSTARRHRSPGSPGKAPVVPLAEQQECGAATVPEPGLYDCRMMGPAIATWLAAGLAQTAGLAAACAAVAACAVAWSVAVTVLRTSLTARCRHRGMRGAWPHPPWHTALAILAAGAVAMLSAGLMTLSATHDAVARIAADGGGSAVLDVSITAPLQASTRRGSVCMAQATVERMEAGGVREPSSARVRLLLGSDACALRPGGRYRVSGDLVQPEYGREAAWMTVRGWLPIRAPTALRSGVTRLQDAFLSVTHGLSEQGRVLVPGLTLGVMGQNSAIDALAPDGSVDAVYAAGLTDGFRNAGIMHLMAVSGGHFVLLATIVTWLMRRVRAPRGLLALALAGAYAALCLVMVPSDSITRAASGGLIAAACLCAGRRGQAMSALCWTVCIAVIVRPGLALSYGFALSVLSVAGIVMLCSRCTRSLGRVMPRCVAEPLAVTLAAQAFSLPVQVMLGSGVPLLAPVANVMVAPLVGFGTICGLAALAVSIVMPPLGFAFAWMASCATALMASCALWLGGAGSVVRWPSGWGGAFAMAGTELAVALGIAMARRAMRLWRRRRDARDGSVDAMPGTAAMIGAADAMPGTVDAMPGAGVSRAGMARENLGQWWRETRDLLFPT